MVQEETATVGCCRYCRDAFCSPVLAVAGLIVGLSMLSKIFWKDELQAKAPATTPKRTSASEKRASVSPVRAVAASAAESKAAESGKKETEAATPATTPKRGRGRPRSTSRGPVGRRSASAARS